VKSRLDTLLVVRGLAPSREQAQRLIRAGKVRVAGHPACKPGESVDDAIDLAVEQPDPYVSRGAYKLLAALDHWEIPVKDRVAVDVGASTGGFTDALLQRGAVLVHALDVGRAQLHAKLLADPRVRSQEGLNVRHLPPRALDPMPSLGVADVSFISLTLLMPAMQSNLLPCSPVVTLIKPQFEAGREQVGKGGVVRDEQVHNEVIEKIQRFGVEKCGWVWHGCIPSPITGPAGNIEFLAYWTTSP